MLRGNLSTRPFYNERVVQAGLTAVAALLGVIALFTAWQLWALTAQQRELTTRIAHDEARAADLRRDASRVRAGIDPKLLEATVTATREANRVIDARTFSWTALFNILERTMPPDIRLQAVTPGVEGDALIVRLVINANNVEPVGQFLDRLEEVGAFTDLRSVDEQALQDGSFNVVCVGRYLGPGAPPEETETEAAAGDVATAPAARALPAAEGR